MVSSKRANGLTRRRFLGASSAVMLALACTPTGSVAGPTAAATASGQAVRGGILRVPIFTEPTPLNAVLTPELSSLLVRRVLYSYLTRIDPETKQPAPDLATKWEVAPDGLSWTFTLRDDVKWHDGAPFSAEDVKFTWDQIADPKNASGERSNYANVKQVDVVDPQTVRFVLSAPLMSLPVIAGATVGILPKHILEGKELKAADDFNNRNPIGTGPFKVKAVVPGSHVELEAFEEFYRGRPNADGIIFKIISDANVRVAQLKSGELDYGTIEATSLAAFENEPNVVLTELPAPEWWYFVVNVGNPLFSDRRVRQALVYGIDRAAVLSSAASGKGTLMTATIPFALKGWYDESLKPYPFDVDRAKSLLAEAGWTPGPDGILTKDGQRFAFKVSVDNTSPVRRQMAVLGQQYWKALGMDVEVNELARASWVTELLEHTFALSVSNTPSSWDPDSQRRFYSCEGGGNFGQYCDEEVEQLLADGAAATDTTKRQEIYKEYQQYVYEDVNAIHGFYPSELRVTSKRLKGVPDLPIRDVLTYADTWYLEG